MKVLSAAAFALSAVSVVPLATEDAPPVVLRSVTVVDVTDGSTRENQTVLVRGGRIAAVGAADAIAVPASATVVDGKGKYLVPGLWDMHTHLFSNDAHPGTDLSAWAFPLYVANAVTGVRDMWTDPDDIAVARRWNDERGRGELLAPYIEWSSEIVDGVPPHWTHARGVATPEEARRVVRELAAGGAGFIKIYWNLTRDVFMALADEARRVGIPFAGHVPTSVSAFEASDAGMKSIEHLTGVLDTCSPHAELFQRTTREEWTPELAAMRWDTFDEGICSQLFARFAKNGTWQVPTLLLTQARLLGQEVGLASTPALKYVPASEKQSWRAVRPRSAQRPLEMRRARFARMLEIVGDMRQAGVGILAGTDVGNPLMVPGFSLHEELAVMVEAGLTPLEALQTATLNPARLLGRSEELGTIALGRLADLVLLEANPLEDIRNTRRIYAVVLNGQLLDREALDEMLAEVERSVAE